jgi:hypothetical protein
MGRRLCLSVLVSLILGTCVTTVWQMVGPVFKFNLFQPMIKDSAAMAGLQIQAMKPTIALPSTRKPSTLDSTTSHRGASQHKFTPALNCNMSGLMQSEFFQNDIKWNNENLSISNCSLDSIDRNFARQCIKEAAPNGIIFMGDSVTRYQYLNLVHYLEHGTWNTDPSKSKPSENAQKFESWTEYYQITNQRLGGHEICDCHRKQRGPGDWSVHNTTVENRYYNDGDIKIAYMQVFGPNQLVQMHSVSLLNISSCNQSRCVQSLCQPGACAPSILPVDYVGTFLQPGVFQRMAGSVPSSHIFLNAGLWWLKDKENGFAVHKQFVIDEVLRFRKVAPGVQVHWKMTTASKRGNKPEFEFARSLVKSGAVDSVYDAWSLTATVPAQHPELMWDTLHFDGPVYQGLNQALIAYLWSLGAETE